jgi:hypothetical protein
MAIRKQYRTMQGKIVDLEKLAAKNELVPAIGNIPVNARGDELGPGGRIIRKREDIVNEYYERNTNFTPIDNRIRKPVEVPVPAHVNETAPTPTPRNVDAPTSVISKAAKKEEPTE